jgi:hypothetical protein
MTLLVEGENLKTWPVKERKIGHGHRLGYKPPTHRTLTSSFDNRTCHQNNHSGVHQAGGSGEAVS